MENKLCNICFLNHARKGRGWAKGQSSEFRELEKLLILLSHGTDLVWVLQQSCTPTSPWALVRASCPLKKHVELCPESTEAEELAWSDGLVK